MGLFVKEYSSFSSDIFLTNDPGVSSNPRAATRIDVITAGSGGLVLASGAYNPLTGDPPAPGPLAPTSPTITLSGLSAGFSLSWGGRPWLAVIVAAGTNVGAVRVYWEA